MARLINIQANEDELGKTMSRLFQSGNINFLIGSGASAPAIPVVGAIEEEIRALLKNDQKTEANLRMYAFLRSVQIPTNGLISNTSHADVEAVVAQYQECLGAIAAILTERATNLLPAQANIFTTNYDLFIEKASEGHSTLRMNDGFVRTPSIAGRITYSAQGFFDSTFNRGPFYNYKVEIPGVNLIKLHGSLSWKKGKDEILCSFEPKPDVANVGDADLVATYVESYAVVLPRTQKFEETLLEGIYYDLLRIYANQLDKENTVLLTFGCSFNDAHIYAITKRALENPTLRLLVFAYSEGAAASFMTKFARYNNVDVVGPETGNHVDFATLIKLMKAYVPDRRNTK